MVSEPTVFIVDDDPAVQKSLRWLIESVGLRAETYGTAQEFLEAYDPDRPGCLVLDVRLPGMSGLDLLEQLAAQNVTTPAIMISGYGDVPMAIRAMKHGAIDFIEKPFKDQRLLDSIHRAIEWDARNRWAQAERLAIAVRAARLTPREREVMDLLVTGKANKQMAAHLGCSGKTVEVHRARVMEKMQADSVADVVRMVLTLGNSSGKTSTAQRENP